MKNFDSDQDFNLITCVHVTEMLKTFFLDEKSRGNILSGVKTNQSN